jgi:hypothetical protein
MRILTPQGSDRMYIMHKVISYVGEKVTFVHDLEIC